MANKYHNIKCELDGYKFDSKKERDYYVELKLRKKARDIEEFKVKPKMVVYTERGIIRVQWADKIFTDFKNLSLVFRYTPDFWIKHLYGESEVIDVKGVQTPVFKLKRRILEALGIKITIK